LHNSKVPESTTQTASATEIEVSDKIQHFQIRDRGCFGKFCFVIHFSAVSEKELKNQLEGV
jgi:hypothetical protein